MYKKKCSTSFASVGSSDFSLLRWSEVSMKEETWVRPCLCWVEVDCKMVFKMYTQHLLSIKDPRYLFTKRASELKPLSAEQAILSIFWVMCVCVCVCVCLCVCVCKLSRAYSELCSLNSDIIAVPGGDDQLWRYQLGFLVPVEFS